MFCKCFTKEMDQFLEKSFTREGKQSLEKCFTGEMNQYQAKFTGELSFKWILDELSVSWSGLSYQINFVQKINKL